jgi:ferrous iron transport protein B
MEDSGYMARAAFIMDKLMHKIGLHGKSFIPMIMGFGCNVPAIMATRTIESRKSRLITMAIIPFMSCSGRLPIFILLAGTFFGSKAALVLLGIYLLGIALAIISAKVLSRFVKDDDLPFVMELPPYRVPTAKAILRHTWENGKQYLQKMATTIFLFSVVIWFLGYFPHHSSPAQVSVRDDIATVASEDASRTGSDNPADVDLKADSYIGYIGRAVEPALQPLGFNWKMSVGLLSGIGAKELIVSTLGVMYSGDDAGVGATSDPDASSRDTLLQRTLKSSIGVAAALAYMVFILLYFPCVATFVAIKNETGGWKWAIGVCVYTIMVAWIFAFITYRIALLF